MKIKKYSILFSIFLLTSSFWTLSCQEAKEPVIESEKPNILWISAEDLSPRMAAYGDSTASTPNLDRLAREGITYTNAFTTAGVCAPSRNSIITGRYQTSNGGHNMRTLWNTYPEQTGLPKSYNSVPPAGVKLFPEYLKAAGYYTTNNVKTDYQFEAPPTVWDEVSNTADWRGREENQPFFSVINFTTTHESQIWARAKNKMRVDPSTVPLPPYYPDHEITRTDVARHYSNLEELDDQIGEVLKKLEEDGLLEKTIIFFWGDHGDGLPFYKREVYRRGLLIPLIARFPNGYKSGTTEDRFISGIDLGPTMLSLAALETTEQMQGKAFEGKYKTQEGHEYIFGARDRLDSEYDQVRSVMDRQYQYVKNYYPEKPLYMDIAFRKNIPTMNLLLEMHEKGELNEAQSLWFRETKPEEELYDYIADPFQLNNLAEDPAYAEKLAELRKVMENWVADSEDLGSIQEKELLTAMWNGDDTPPITADVQIYQTSDMVKLNCMTAGASIAYRKENSKRWEVYTKPLNLEAGNYETMAMRVGYEPSDTLRFRVR
ncbi:sulfatase family protein [Jiulongibacter sp. NS-SX5]|uniref:sulfatase family protein n=1 Tax=Jiulongibacter sp. NS-SX5 TaxID=3463854 RepID=UPI004059E231